MAVEIYLSLSEVATLLETTLRTIQRHCAAGKYLTRAVKSDNGGGKNGLAYEVALSSLPKPAQAHYLREHPEETADPIVQAAKLAVAKIDLQERIDKKMLENTLAQGVKDYLALEGQGKKRADAKLVALGALDALMAETQLKGRAAVEEFCLRYNDGRLPVDAWVKKLIKHIHPATLYRWNGKLKHDGAGSLAGAYGHRKGQSLIDTQPDIIQFLVAMIADKPHVSNKGLRAALSARFAGLESIQLPSQRALDRWMAAWKQANPDLLTALANPDEFKNKFMTAFGDSAADVLRLNQRWLADSSPADLMLSGGRYHLIAMLDVYSRRLKILVTKTSKATAITLLLRRCILAWGMLEELKTDNGQDYASHHLALCAQMLHFSQKFSAPFSPWEKGHVERAFRTFAHGLAELLPGFLGHNVEEQQAIRAKQAFSERLFKKNEVIDVKMTPEDLQAVCDRWCDSIYERTAHAGLNGKRPYDMAAEWRGEIKYIANERTLDLLLAEAPGDGWRTVGKKGIKLDNEDYIAPELERYVGQRVQVRLDTGDMGRIYVYAHDRPDDPFLPNAVQPGLHFVCIAHCAALLGADRQEVAIVAKAKQTKRIQDAKKTVKQAVRKQNLKDIAFEVLAQKEKEAREEKIVHFPNQHRVEHDGPGIQAAKSALEWPREETDAATPAAMHRMLDASQSRPLARPLFDSYLDKALYLCAEWMAERYLSGEEMKWLTELWRTQPSAYRDALDITRGRYAGNELYAAFKQAVNWQ